MSAEVPVFTLSYVAELDDLIEWSRMDPRRKRARRRTAWSIVSALVIVGAITALAVVLSLPSATGQQSPAWLLYLVAAFGWLGIVRLLRRVWHMSPAAAGRHTWQAVPEFHGPHQEEVSQAGIRGLGPDQPDVFYPWADLTAVEETSRAFYVHNRAGVAAVLPKRGLPDARLIPDLRQFLHQAVAAPGGAEQAGGADQAAAAD